MPSDSVRRGASVREAAQAAVRAGLCVIPPAEDGSKRPVSTWRKYQTERPSPDRLRAWFGACAGLGVVCGQVSGGLECFEFDDRAAYESFKALAHEAELDALVTRLEAGYCEETPGGGVHWLYRSAEIGGNTKLASRPKRPDEQRDGADIIKTLIETRGEGGYVILAPSGGRVHPSGRPYRLKAGGFATIPTLTPTERRELHQLARALHEDAKPTARAAPSRPVEGGARPGDDFTARTTWPELLEPHGWARIGQQGERTLWRRPGKREGVSATTNHAGSDLLWVFSTSTPFESERSYDRFGAYAVLEHGGDQREAARALSSRGYGRPMEGRPATPDRAERGGAGVERPDGGQGVGVRLEDFHAFMPAHLYLFAPAREMWPGASVNARLGSVPFLAPDDRPVNDGVTKSPRTVKATAWLDQHRAVEQMTWVPGAPMLLRDRLVSEGGWINRPGCTTFNLYRPPHDASRGRASDAGPWVDHVRRIYPDQAEHILCWAAHRLQRPAEKVNHALVLGGAQGVGKDSLLEPVKYAIGPWNFAEVSPAQLLGRFNGFIKSVILRISEARDLGDVDRYCFYDHMKVLAAAPPDVLRVDEKNLREYSVFNVCGVVLTTNHKIGGLYLPADDRRHFVAWTDATREDFTPNYWTKLYQWFERGGRDHVAAFLREYDLADFNPKAPPPKTEAFWEIVDADRAPEDADLADTLDRLDQPPALTLADLIGLGPSAFGAWLGDRKNARQVPHRMEKAGYVPVRNPAAKDGLWKLNGRRQVIYGRHELSQRDRLAAAGALVGGR